MNEFEFIETLKDFLPPSDDRVVGIGDDCAVIKKPGVAKSLLVTTDMLAENVHFRKSWGHAKAIAFKSVAVNISDIAAMGGIPQYLFWSLAIPKHDLHLLQDLKDGVYEACRVFQVHLFGGNTCASDSGLILSHTLLGEAEHYVLRSTAKAGDLIYCTGVVGDGGLALDVLEKRAVNLSEAEKADLIERYFYVKPKVKLAHALAQGQLASSMIDISDGLFQDLGHVLKASHLAAQIDENKIPLSNAMRKAQKPLHGAATAGEDYELLFTVAPDAVKKVKALGFGELTCIGKMVQPQGAGGIGKIVDMKGKEIAMEKKGFQHF